MISKDSKEMLQYFFDLELNKFIKNGSTIGQLQKQQRMDECRIKMINFMLDYSNSIFFIKNTEKNGIASIMICIPNMEEKTDHITKFLITISPSCETFRVEKQLGYYTELKTNDIIIDYEKGRL